MLRKLAFCLLTGLLLWPAAQNQSRAQAPAQSTKQWKDREEFDLYDKISKEQNPTQRLQLLDQWKQKYPDSQYKDVRLGVYIQTYQQAGQPAKAVEAANELLTITPEDFTANYTIAAMTPFLNSTDQRVWENGAKAANMVLKILDAQFSDENKAKMKASDADWANAKKGAQFISLQTLGWVAMMQKKNDEAEQQFIKALDVNPNAAQLSYWLGSVVLAEKNPDKNALALFEFARAASLEGQGALTPQARQQIDAYLTKVYKTYHGDDPKGLSDLKALAKATPLPPADLKIKSKDEIDAENAEKFAKENPMLAKFMQIKDGLTGPQGSEFWAGMKGTQIPDRLSGTVVSAKPAVKPKVVEIAISQKTTPEVTITTPETSARCQLDPGAPVEFEGAEVKDFTPNPFMLRLENAKIVSGCKEAPPPPKKAVKKAVKKAE